MATPAPTHLLQRPLVGFGLATAALVALVTGGTGLLLSQGARQLQPPAPLAVAPVAPSAPSAPVVVRRPPGSVALPPPRLAGPVVLGPVAPVVDPEPAAPVVEPPAAPPVVQPPVDQPPAVEPPVVEPPVVQPPVAEPEERPGRQPRKPEARRDGPKGQGATKEHPDDRGKHLGQLKH